MTITGNAVNSVKANSRKKGLCFTKEQLSELYFDRNMDLVEIGEMYGVSSSAILYWVKKLGINYRRRLQEILDFPSPALSYILGVLHGDGFIYTGGGRRQIILSVTDQEFALSFARALNIIGINTFTIPIKPQHDGWKTQYKTVGESLRFIEYFNSLLVEERIKAGMMFPVDFIRGVYESEGSVKYHKGRLELSIYTTSEILRNVLTAHLKTSCYSVKNFSRILESGKTFYYVSLYKEFEIKKFMTFINPCIKYKPRSAYANTEPSLDSNIEKGVESTKAIRNKESK